MARSSGKGGQNPIYGAAIPLSKSVKLDLDALVNELRTVVSQAGARVRLLEEPKARRRLFPVLGSGGQEFAFEIAAVPLTISASPRPFCSAAAMHSFVNPAVWRGGASRMTGHKAHILVAEPDGQGGGNTDAMFDRATAVTLATAAVASMVEAEGVVWLPARNALPMGTFGSEMERFIDGQAPLQFWVRTQILPPPVQEEREFGELSGEALQPGVATLGLTAFMGAEIIAPPSNCDREVMLDHIYALASAVIDENAELKDGAVYGKPGEPMVLLHWRKSGAYSERPYWELLPRPTAAAKGRSSDEAEPGQGPGPERHLRLVIPGS
jgi:hypothetical protein